MLSVSIRLPFAIILWGLLITGLSTLPVAASTEVTVGVYPFPPMAIVNDNQQVSGLVGAVLEELNRRQDDLVFSTLATSAKRRFMDFRQRRYDVIFFESPRWGWEQLDVEFTPPILEDEDIFIALKKPGRDQDFFNALQDRKLLAMMGYHYQFADMETNQAALRRRFDIEFSRSHRRNIELILADRPSIAEIAVVNRSFLQQYLHEHPDAREQLMIAEVPDQRYQLRVLCRKGGAVECREITRLLRLLVGDGSYGQLVRGQGLTPPTTLIEQLSQD